jgi:hypothetical protein
MNENNKYITYFPDKELITKSVLDKKSNTLLVINSLSGKYVIYLLFSFISSIN